MAIRKSQRKIVIFGKDDDAAHRMLGVTFGRDGEYDMTRLIEHEELLGGRYSVWSVSDYKISYLEGVARSAREKGYNVVVCTKVGRSPYKEHVIDEKKPSSKAVAESRRLLKAARTIKRRRSVSRSTPLDTTLQRP
ncbi:MAG TPA: hypothetical protein VHD69_00700 [Candidatus Paceibacterota bacterium]|jgi:hypothetical protein|nr:hypothetical protein [Candidatus Paceibacterota bacterium]